MPQQLRACTILTEGLGSSPSTNTVGNSPSAIPVVVSLMPSSGLHRLLHTHSTYKIRQAHIHKQQQNQRNQVGSKESYLNDNDSSGT